jgi:3-deoxy-7-phosphoheptulonate synthase
MKRASQMVLWCCDPTHGNTSVAAGGLKTRGFDNILGEFDRRFTTCR